MSFWVYMLRCADGKNDAFRAEFTLKNWSRGKKGALIAGDWALVSYLARPPRERVSTSLDTSGVGVPVT